MNRQHLLYAMGLGLVAVAVVAWWWTQPNPAWACNADDQVSRCVSQVALDIEGLDLDSPRLGFRSLGVSPDGTQVVAGLNSTGNSGSTRAAVVIFDAASGEARNVLLTINNPDGAEVEEPTYSPDGSFVAVAVLEGARAEVVVLDVQTGEEVIRLFDADDVGEPADCIGRLAISPDNSKLQCDGSVFSLTDGRALPKQNTVEYYANYLGRFAISRTNLRVDVRDNIATATPTNGPTFEIGLSEAPDPDRRQVALSPTQTLVGNALSFDDGFTLRSPRRSRPGGVLRLIDLDSRAEVFSVELDAGFDHIEWSGDGTRLVGITDDLRISIFEVD